MSALSAIGKQLDALSASLGVYHANVLELKGQPEVSQGTYRKLVDLARAVDKDITTLHNNVKTDVDKLVLKLDHKDPVTGALRYGEGSKAKIVGFAKKVEELLPEFAQLQSDLKDYTNVAEKVLGNTVLTELPIDIKLSRLQAPVMGPIRNIDRFVEFPISSSATPVAMSPDDIELEEKARQVRERKAHEAEHLRKAQEQLHCQLESYMSYFNSIHDLQAKRVASKSQSSTVLERIAQLAPNDTKLTQREALKTILGIVERIISRPDDIAARRLRITHPVLKEKLTGVSGGIELLMALGFRARLQKLEAPAETKPTSAAQLMPLSSLEATLALHHQHPLLHDSSNIPSTPIDSPAAPSANLGVNIFELLSPATLYDVHLEMQEPSLESLTSSSADGSGKVDKLSWLDWFDSLGTYKANIEEALTRT